MKAARTGTLVLAGLMCGTSASAEWGASSPPQEAPRLGDVASLPLPIPALELPADEGDGRRTLGRFAANLGRSVTGVWSSDTMAPLLIGATVAGAASFADDPAQRFMLRQAHGFGEIGAAAGHASVVAPVTLGLFAAGRLAGSGTFRAATYDMTQAVLVNSLYTTALKTAMSRQRPDGSDQLSLPSGHTSNAFAMATVAEAHWGPKVGVPAFVAASAIGLSRMQSNKHHLSDVLAGATIGYVVGRTVVRENGGPRAEGTHFRVLPATDAHGGGIGAALSVQW